MPERLKIDLPDEAATSRLGAALSARLQPGDIIALHGDLGAGKTTLARALIRALCGAETEIPSPTYTLLQTYPAPDFPIYHFDLYRLEDPSEIIELGWDDTGDGLSLIEWPGRAGPHLPQSRLDVHLALTGKTRIATLEPRGEDWQTRLHAL